MRLLNSKYYTNRISLPVYIETIKEVCANGLCNVCNVRSFLGVITVTANILNSLTVKSL